MSEQKSDISQENSKEKKGEKNFRKMLTLGCILFIPSSYSLFFTFLFEEVFMFNVLILIRVVSLVFSLSSIVLFIILLIVGAWKNLISNELYLKKIKQFWKYITSSYKNYRLYWWSYLILFIFYEVIVLLFIGWESWFATYLGNTQYVIDSYSWIALILGGVFIESTPKKLEDFKKDLNIDKETHKFELKYEKRSLLFIIIFVCTSSLVNIWFGLIVRRFGYDSYSYIPIGSNKIPTFPNVLLAFIYFQIIATMLAIGVFFSRLAYLRFRWLLNTLKELFENNFKNSLNFEAIMGGNVRKFLDLNDKRTLFLLIPNGFLMLIGAYFGLIFVSSEAGLFYGLYGLFLLVRATIKNNQFEKHVKREIGKFTSEKKKPLIKNLEKEMKKSPNKLEYSKAYQMLYTCNLLDTSLIRAKLDYRSYLFVTSIISLIVIILNYFKLNPFLYGPLFVVGTFILFFIILLNYIHEK